MALMPRMHAPAGPLDIVLKAAQDRSERVLLSDEEIELTGADFLNSLVDTAAAFEGQGLTADETLVLSCGRGLTFWIELCAAWMVGAAVVCIDGKTSPDQGEHICRSTHAKFYIGDQATQVPAFGACKALPPARIVIQEDKSSAIYEVSPAVPEQTAAYIFTSGTTGLPKGIALPHGKLTHNALSTRSRLELRETDKLLIATPFRFISSISHFLVTLLSGAEFMGIERPLMIRDLMLTIKDKEVSAFGGSPFHLNFLAQAGAKRLPGLRWFMSSGDHLRPDVIRTLTKNFPDAELHVVYGMAELGGRYCHLPYHKYPEKIGSSGTPIDGLSIQVLNENILPCEPGDVGNIWASGPLGFSGYIGNADTNSRILKDQLFLTGDVGHLDEDGFVFLSGRSDAVFKRSGQKVSTLLITEVLFKISDISDAFVYALDHQIEGKFPVAWVALKPESNLDKTAILKTLRNQLPNKHLPYDIKFLPAIPRTGSGKVIRKEIDMSNIF